MYSLLSQLKELSVTLKVADGQLRINAPKGALSKELLAELKERKEEIIAFLTAEEPEERFQEIAPTEKPGPYDLSPAQQRIWLAHLLDEDGAAYNISGVYALTGDLNSLALERSFSTLIQRHEILRTCFIQKEGRPVQQVIDAGIFPFRMSHIDLGAEKPSQESIRQIAAEEAYTRFDLETGPLLKVKLARLGRDHHVLFLTIHHIIFDGWSMGVLLDELGLLYKMFLQGQENMLPALKIQYKDYSVWQNGLIATEAFSKQGLYWKEQLSPPIPDVRLETDYPGIFRKTLDNGWCELVISEEETKKIQVFSADRGISLFMTLMSAVNILVYRYTRHCDLTIGTLTNGRNHPDTTGQLGCYLNLLPLRTRFGKDDTVDELVQKVKKNILDAFDHEAYPFELILSDLTINREPGRSPLFNIMAVLQKEEPTARHGAILEELSMEEMQISPALPKYDLSFFFVPIQGSLKIQLEYDPGRFSGERMGNLLDHLQRILTGMQLHPSQRVDQLDYLSTAEKRQLLTGFNQTKMPYPLDRPFQELFEAQLEMFNDLPAVSFGEATITYRELNRRANQLAHYLLTNYHPQPGDIIAFTTRRSQWWVIGMLGILKAGAAYLPVNPEVPVEGVNHTLSDSKAIIFITGSGRLYEKDAITGTPQLSLEEQWETISSFPEENPGVTSGPGDIVYVLYTSGSTGAPKGVMIEQHSLVNFCYWHIDFANITSQSRATVYSSISFDVSMSEIWPFLLAGAHLFIVREEQKLNLRELVSYVNEKHITHLFVPTVVCRQLEDPGFLFTNKDLLVITAGEELKKSSVRGLNVLDYYGPTETTITSLAFPLAQAAAGMKSIGRPIANTLVYIMDDNHNLLPAGNTGEIWIGGEGVARGYLNNVPLTESRFIMDPFGGNSRFYKTGDLGHWLPDGNVLFKGRMDNQVKIRGNRVEPSEIEQVLLRSGLVKDGVVLAKADVQGENYLIAFYKAAQGEDQADALRRYLSRFLPGYMIPAWFIYMDRFPETINGKVDRKALSLLEPLLPAIPGDEDDSAWTATQKSLARIWKEILPAGNIGLKVSFFDIGGHSLKAMQVISRIYSRLKAEISLKVLFRQPTIEGLAAHIDQQRPSIYRRIEPAPVREYYDVSGAQKRLWILQQLEGSQYAYNIPGSFSLQGQLDVPSFEFALNSLICRHEILRTTFTSVNGTPKQKIHSPGEKPFHLPLVNLTGWADAASQTAELLDKMTSHRFDLEAGPLLETSLIKLSDQEHIFLINIHHIITDAWSTKVILHDIMRSYNDHVEGRIADLPPLRIQYKDYSEWLQQVANEDGYEEHRAYWRNLFDSHPPVLDLTTDQPRPSLKTYNGDTIRKKLPASLLAALYKLSHQQNTSLFMTVLALVKTLLYRYTGQEDIVVGSPIASRDHGDLEDQIGFYTNTLPIRTRIDGEADFPHLLQKIKEQTLDAYEHAAYPFDLLIEDLNIERNLSRSPLFDILVDLQDPEGIPDTKQLLKNLSITRLDIDTPACKFDLTFTFQEKDSMIELRIEYNTDLFLPERINRMIAHFETLATQVLSNPQLALHQLPYLAADELHQVTRLFNDTSYFFPQQKTVHQLFELQAANTPDIPAIVYQEKSLTYRELNERANQLAHFLAEERGIGTGDFVVSLLSRSEQIGSVLLAIFKCGACYVPLDPGLPKSRIDYILGDVKPKLILADHCILIPDAVAGFSETPYPELDAYNRENPAVHVTFADLSYIVYTSGSEGNPKGVTQTHRTLFNLVCWQLQFSGIKKGLKALQYSSFGFDLSLLDFFFSFCGGGTIYIAPEPMRSNFILLEEYIANQEIELLAFPFSVLRELFGQVSFYHLSRVKHIISTGEQLVVGTRLESYLKDFVGVKLHNLYGPSETHVVTAFSLDSQSEKIAGPALIGKPISNTSIFILDDHLQVLPAAIRGNVYIGGDNLATGYLNQQSLTEKRFIQWSAPDGLPISLYKTGDIGKWHFDGNIEYFGRRDSQVKIRGNRVELGEIESHLLKAGGVSEAVVIASGETGKELRLIGYLIAKTRDEHSIKAFLKEHLPEYMIPSQIVFMDSLPLTSNGKVDIRSLPDPGEIIAGEYAEAVNQVQYTIIGIWQDILSRDRIGIHDNFFEMGGHSLKAMRLVSTLYQTFGIKVDLNIFFRYPTVAGLADFISRQTAEGYVPIQPVPESGDYAISHAQRRLWIEEQFEESPIVYNVPGAYLFKGKLDRQAFERSFSTLIERHESLRTSFPIIAKEPRQKILPVNACKFHLEFLDLSEWKKDDSPFCDEEEFIQHIATTEVLTGFDLQKGPLLRARLIQKDAQSHVFLLTLHHIIADGWSLEVLVKEISVLYNFYKNNKEVVLPALPIQYRDYSAWQQKKLTPPLLDEQREFWKKTFEGDIQELLIPADLVKPSKKSYRGGQIKGELSASLSLALSSITRNREVTFFMLYAAAVKTLLFRYTGQNDIVVGTPVAGRDHPDLKDQIGFYVNTIALRTKLDCLASFAGLLQDIKVNTLAALKYQDYPYDWVVSELRAVGRAMQTPLFNVLINVRMKEDLQDRRSILEDITIETYDTGVVVSEFNLAWTFLEKEAGWDVAINFDSDLYRPERIQQMLEHFTTLLWSVAENDELPLNKIEYLSTVEKKQQLFDFNTNVYPFPDTTLHTLLEEQAAKTPDNIAVKFEGGQLTYKELNEKANQLSAYLTGVWRVRPEEPVGLLVERSEKVLICIFGILKAGGAYVPMDPAYPRQKLSVMIRDTGIRLSLVSQAYIDLCDELQWENDCLETHICIDEAQEQFVSRDGLNEKRQLLRFKAADFSSRNLRLDIESDRLAYIMYTSGSTGTPNGVMVEHRSVVNLAGWLLQLIYKDSPPLTTIVSSSIHFDMSGKQLYPPLFCGSTLVLVPESKMSGARSFLQILRKYKVDVLDITPSYLKTLIATLDEDNETITIKHTICGGEWLSQHILLGFYRRFAAPSRLINAYGPTEATINASYEVVDRTRDNEYSIGTALPNLRLYILDPDANILPIGAMGEICISGINVARGYLIQRPSNSHKFISNPYFTGDHGRLYRTGDMGKWLPDGRIEFSGRIDHQVKINGIRVELQEIENTLQEFPSIGHAAVIVTEDQQGRKDIVAYLTKKPGGTSIEQLDGLTDDDTTLSVDDGASAADTAEGPVIPFPAGRSIPHFVQEQAVIYGEGIALRYKDKALTYAELNAMSDRTAAYLHNTHGVTKGTLVAVMMDRTEKMAIDILAIWKCSGIYVPIDPTYPFERITAILEDCRCGLLLTGGDDYIAKSRMLTGVTVVDTEMELKETEEEMTTAWEGRELSDMAYIIYTSGSSGKPKGVMVQHSGMMNHIWAKIRELGIGKSSIVAQNASQCFDISIWQFFAAFVEGGTTMIYSNDLIREPDLFMDTLISDGVTILEVVPSYLSLLLDILEEKETRLPDLRYLLLTGERLAVSLVKRWFDLQPSIRMVNAYGPTEASDDITHHIMDRVPDGDQVPLGRPIQNCRIYIVDENGRKCPAGVKGEIWVSGICVGKGYLNDKEKTARAFVNDPFLETNEVSSRGNEPVPLFKTGDYGRLSRDGTLEFFGRKDQQIKIRGHRIELGEIETALLQQVNIKEAVVRVWEKGPDDKQLCAYLIMQQGQSADQDWINLALRSLLPEYMLPLHIVSLAAFPLTANGKINRNALPDPFSFRDVEDGFISAVRSFLVSRLPMYAIPAYFMVLDELPLNKNRKLDRKALLALGLPARRQASQFLLPENEIQRTLTGMWQQVLETEQISITDNFFEIGGNSLRLIKLFGLLRDTYHGIKITDLFDHPTVIGQAELLEGRGLAANPADTKRDMNLTELEF
ncbi:MAG TPA: amino acid adenylation domain-containing protein [Puia sp.]|nr:amino acid adenylation domain-containing protein [Puia sp.]